MLKNYIARLLLIMDALRTQRHIRKSQTIYTKYIKLLIIGVFLTKKYFF